MLIQDQVTVFQWLLYIKYGGSRLARWVTLQHYFGTTLLKGCRPWYTVYHETLKVNFRNNHIKYLRDLSILVKGCEQNELPAYDKGAKVG
jgi:hypothetical protein